MLIIAPMLFDLNENSFNLNAGMLIVSIDPVKFFKNCAVGSLKAPTFRYFVAVIVPIGANSSGNLALQIPLSNFLFDSFS